MRITARLKCLHLGSVSGRLDELLPTRKPQGWRDAAYNKAIVSRPLGHLQYGTAVAEGQTDQPRFTLDPDSPTYRLPSSLSFERRLKKASNSFDRRTHDGSKSPRWGGSEPPKSPKWGVSDGALFSKLPQTAPSRASNAARSPPTSPKSPPPSPRSPPASPKFSPKALFDKARAAAPSIAPSRSLLHHNKTDSELAKNSSMLEDAKAAAAASIAEVAHEAASREPSPSTAERIHQMETTRTTVAFNQLIRLHSQKAELVMTNLPLPQLAQSTDAYMTHLEELVHGIERVMLVAGQKDADVITMYS